ncbi:hypothetical protein [Asticcacaulis sp. 201]|uniref:hypothetical protein n=1 Tax=Asticcacaulis sp. 201 TaxID=3028787 RepID=UPI002915F316|nr:hypothetical protein [Asticcacaulis sp. 201]MDV6330022.1 hypothetical protein [Asticcacaulis sp. 201]
MIKPVHPFPARMAPELALRALGNLPKNSIVLDPMTGSGTVLRQAVEFGHTAIGYDVDPLAVLMSNVWSSTVDSASVTAALNEVLDTALQASDSAVSLPWLDSDPETLTFVKFWFADRQSHDLRRLAYALDQVSAELSTETLNVLKLAISRIIVTKEQAASLARDTSHSRPHRVTETNEYDVYSGFKKATLQILQRLNHSGFQGHARAGVGDARKLGAVADKSIDAIITSPPYLNAIDYMRGHKLALVWLGYTIKSLREIRAGSIGAEKSIVEKFSSVELGEIMTGMGELHKLPAKNHGMIRRYVDDMCVTFSEVSRVLKSSGRATFVVGNSCLRGVYIKNSEAVRFAAIAADLELIDSYEREIPEASRYLPVTGTQLAKRMRTETILTFQAA